MADNMFNIAKLQMLNGSLDLDTDALDMLLLETDDEALTADDLAAYLGGTAVELTSTGYSRSEDLAGQSASVDDPGDEAELDLTDVVFSTVSQDAAEVVVAAIIVKDNGAGDANKIPIFHIDASVTPNGGDITIQFAAEGVAKVVDA